MVTSLVSLLSLSCPGRYSPLSLLGVLDPQVPGYFCT